MHLILMLKNGGVLKILIVNTHGMGDVIMTLPTIDVCLSSGQQIFLLLKSQLEKKVVELYLPRFKRENIFVLKDYTRKRSKLSLIFDLRRLKINLLIPVYSTHPELLSMLKVLSGAKKNIGFGGWLGFLNTKNLVSWSTTHKVLFNLNLIKEGLNLYGYGLDIMNDVKVPMPMISDVGQFAQLAPSLKDKDNLIGICPGSGDIEKHKRWPSKNYARLVDFLSDSGFEAVILGGPNECELAKDIESQIKSKAINLVGKLTIKDTFFIISRLKASFTNCNGLSHICSSLGVPTIGIYGPTKFEITGPWGDNACCVSLDLDCSPCYRRGFIQGCGNPVCLTELPLDMVINQFNSLQLGK